MRQRRLEDKILSIRKIAEEAKGEGMKIATIDNLPRIRMAVVGNNTNRLSFLDGMMRMLAATAGIKTEVFEIRMRPLDFFFSELRDLVDLRPEMKSGVAVKHQPLELRTAVCTKKTTTGLQRKEFFRRKR